MENNVDILILGVFGSWAFDNDLKLVSNMFKRVLIDEEYFKYFSTVYFSIFIMPHEAKNLNEFPKTFENYFKKLIKFKSI